MAIYPSSGGFIGSLLRTIQEERSKAPHVLPPAGEPQAPIRAAVQAPLESPISPESPGSSRTVSIRPEGVPPTSASTPPGQIVPPFTIIGDRGGVSPIIREKFPEAFNGSEASAVQNQPSQSPSTAGGGQMDAQTAQLVAENKKTLAGAQQPRKISDAMTVSNITDKINTYKPEVEQYYKNQLAAAQQKREQKRQLDEQISRANEDYARRHQGLFQQLSSGIQGATKSAASKIQGLFQRLR